MQKHIEQEFINMKIEKEINILSVIKLDNTDIDDMDENTCGAEIDLIPPKIKKIQNKKICYKCKKNNSNYANRTEFICKECLLKVLNHKFRSNLRAHCKIRNEDFVLVCISGGNSSMAMLHWFYSTFNDNTSHRKLFFKLKVLHVDDSLYYMLKEGFKFEEIIEERVRRRNYIEGLCKKYGFEFDVINLEESVNGEENNISKINNMNSMPSSNSCSIDKYLKIYKNISKVGSFNEDFNNILTRNLIFQYALKNNFNKIVFANSAQSLVNNIFSTVVKGRGFSLREDLGYIDNHYLNGKITVLKPMRDFLTKEILLNNYINKVEIIYSPLDLINEANGNKVNLPYNGNTSHLIKNFFDNLQDKMASTVTTVMGTAEKLEIKKMGEQKVCRFCQDYIDEVYNELEIGSLDTVNNDTFCFGCKRMFQSIQDDEEVMKSITLF